MVKNFLHCCKKFCSLIYVLNNVHPVTRLVITAHFKSAMARDQTQAILFEILRSFTSLARTLSTPKSVAELGVTRQTLHRHIKLLEESKGAQMFRLVDRRYELTEAGENALPEAQDLLARGEAWVKGNSGHVNQLFHVTYEDSSGVPFFLQQHPISEIWTSGHKLFSLGLKCWANSRGQIESPEFIEVRPYVSTYRFTNGTWICAEVGPSSSLADWFGWAWAKSSVGRAIDDLPGGTFFSRLLAQPYDDVRKTQGVRLDHVYTYVPRKHNGEPVPISYKRLLMGCQFPDGSPAIVSIIDRRKDIEIAGLDLSTVTPMLDELVMKVDLSKNSHS